MLAGVNESLGNVLGGDYDKMCNKMSHVLDFSCRKNMVLFYLYLCKLTGTVVPQTHSVVKN